MSNKNSHLISRVVTDNRQIIPMKSQEFLQTPQGIMEGYNGCSVPQYPANVLPFHLFPTIKKSGCKRQNAKTKTD